MKKSLVVLIIFIGFMGSMVAMESTYVETTEDRLVISSGNDKQGFITVQTSDEKEVIISKEIAKQIPTINNLIEDIGGESAPIPLPLVSSKEFEFLARALEMFNQALDKKNNLREFFHLIKYSNFSVAGFIPLANASQYLGLEDFEDELIDMISSFNSIAKEISFDLLQKMNSGVLKRLWEFSSIYSELVNIKKIDGAGVIISPDGNSLVSYGNNTIKIWNLNDLNERPQELSHEKVRGVVISPDGNTLISWSGQTEQERFFNLNPDVGTIKIWNFNDLDQEPQELYELAVSKIITDGIVLIANIRTSKGPKIWRLNQLDQLPWIGDNYIDDFVLIQNPNGNKLVSWSGKNHWVDILDLNTFESQQLIYREANEDIIMGNSIRVIISHANRKMIIGCYVSEVIKIWDLNNIEADPELLDIQNMDGISLSNDGSKLIAWTLNSESQNYVIKIWDLNNLNKAFEDIIEDRILSEAIISPDGSKLIYWGFDQLIMRDFNSRKILARLNSSSHFRKNAVISPNGSMLITFNDSSVKANNFSVIKVWDFNLLNVLNNLNEEQVMFFMWLQYPKNAESLSPDLLQYLKNIYQTLPENLKNIAREKFPVVKLLIPGGEVEPEPVVQQEPELVQPQVPQEVQPEGQQALQQLDPVKERAQPQLPQMQQEPELVQQQAPQEAEPQAQQQPSLWQRWLNLFRTQRLWTAPN